MNSAVRWIESDTSGKLEPVNHGVALRRCVVRDGRGKTGTFRLPAGLSAALGNRAAGLSLIHVVPIKSGFPRNAMERAAQGSGGVDLLDRLAAEVASPQRLNRPRRQASLDAAGSGDRSNTTSSEVLVKRSRRSSAASAGMISTGVVTSRSFPSAALEQVTTEPSAAPGLVEKQLTAGRGALRAVMADGPHQPSALQRAIRDDKNRGKVTTIPPSLRSQDTVTVPFGTSIKPFEAALDGVPSRRGSESAWPALEMMKAANTKFGVRSQIKPSSASSELSIAMVGIAPRASSYDRALSGRDVVPRGAINPRLPVTAARSGDTMGSTSMGSQRGRGSQYQTPPERVSSDSGSSAGQGGQAGLIVALRGEVLMDGRKMGRLVATGQTSAASLPTRSGSAVNLRAMPIFAGTGAPL